MAAQVLPSLIVHGDTVSQDSRASTLVDFATISKQQATSETCTQDEPTAQPTLSDAGSTALSDDEAITLSTVQSQDTDDQEDLKKLYCEFSSVKKRDLWIQDGPWADAMFTPPRTPTEHADPMLDTNIVEAVTLESFSGFIPSSPDEKAGKKAAQEEVEESSSAEVVDVDTPDPQPEYMYNAAEPEQQVEQPERQQTREEAVFTTLSVMATTLLPLLKVKLERTPSSHLDTQPELMAALLRATEARLQKARSHDEIMQLHAIGPFADWTCTPRGLDAACTLRGSDVAGPTWRRLRSAAELVLRHGDVDAALSDLWAAPAGDAHRYQCGCGAEMSGPVPASAAHRCRSTDEYNKCIATRRAHSGPCQGKQGCSGEVVKMYGGTHYCNKCFQSEHRNLKPHKMFTAKPPCCKSKVESVRQCPECDATFCAECCLRWGPISRIEPQGLWPVEHEHEFQDAFERCFNTPMTQRFRMRQRQNAFVRTGDPLFKNGKECIVYDFACNGRPQHDVAMKIKAPSEPRKTLTDSNQVSTNGQAAEGLCAETRGVKLQIYPADGSQLKPHVQRRNLHATDSGALRIALALQAQTPGLGPDANIIAYARPDKVNRGVAQKGDYKDSYAPYFTVFVELKQGWASSEVPDAAAAVARFEKMKSLELCWAGAPRPEQFRVDVQSSAKGLSESDRDTSCQWRAPTAEQRRYLFAEEAALGYRQMSFDELFFVGRKQQQQQKRGGGARAAAPGRNRGAARAWQQQAYLPSQPQFHPEAPMYQQYQPAECNAHHMYPMGYPVQEQNAYGSPPQVIYEGY